MKSFTRIGILLVICGLLWESCHKKSDENYLQVLPSSLHFSNDSSVKVLNVQSNTDWRIINATNNYSWFSVDSMSGSGDGRIAVRVQDNQGGENREGQIAFDAGGISRIVRVSQGVMSTYPDGFVMPLQQSTYGDSIHIVILGEGFAGEDLAIEGNYAQIMREAARCFFSIEPYSTYSPYFSVYGLVAESEEQGIGVGSASVKNKFSTYLVNEKMTRLVCDHERVRDFVRFCIPRTDSVTTCVIMVVNSTEYAGTTNVYPDKRFAISMCPMSGLDPPNDLEGLIHHEAGGHGFGLLGDEYHFYEEVEISNAERQNIRNAQWNGLWLNLDITGDTARVLWHELINVRYPQVGLFEGGFYYGKGVWRSEYNSCMNDNIPYYSLWCRWLIVRRIMKLSGIKGFSFKDFIKQDNVMFPPFASSPVSRGMHTGTVPRLSPPEIVE